MTRPPSVDSLIQAKLNSHCPFDWFQTPLTSLKGIGDKFSEKLARLGLMYFEDALFHLPLRYIDKTRIQTISQLSPQKEALISVVVLDTRWERGKRNSLYCQVQDATGQLGLRFYHSNRSLQQRLMKGQQLRAYGVVRIGRSGWEMYHPELEWVSSKAPDLPQHLTPIYPTTEGISQNRLQTVIQQVFSEGAPELPECLPETFLEQHALPTLWESLQFLHCPPSSANRLALEQGNHPCQQRLVIEELLSHQLCLHRQRQKVQAEAAWPLPQSDVLLRQFLAQLPFELTDAQQRVYREIADDLSSAKPMLRLLQGDVGSGKTVVAALTALHAVANGKQVAIMAPTEILAEQHKQQFIRWMTPLNISVAWLNGKQKSRERKRMLSTIADGDAQIVVGTHALFQDAVVFADLSLTIIDEQHRFGVQQRLRLQQKSHRQRPHLLVMTATPIPRTLAMSYYSDLDVSKLDGLPPGRTPVTTVALSQERKNQVIERLNAACDGGGQAYWVCTLIEESESLAAEAAEARFQYLQTALPNLELGLVHGRMSASEKEAIMARFKSGKVHVLVATTVIEVGVDVPNAHIMVIENPERLGLAQLHQLRGRVGRGAKASHCVLLYQSPLSSSGRQRIETLRKNNCGFAIAEADLALRGPGEVLGTRQTGDMHFRIADLQTHAYLLPTVRSAAIKLIHNSPQTADQLIHRWFRNGLSLAQV